jgi:hypothetical protein
MSLPDINQVFNDVANACVKLDAKGEGFALPSDIKEYFSTLWKTSTGHNAIISEGLIRLYTSTANSEIVTDTNLTKAILAKPLYDAFTEYRNHVLRLEEKYSIPNFKTEFKKKAAGEPPSWARWEEAIDEDDELDDAGKGLIKLFLTDSKAFKDIKGLARKGDFAAPALIRAMGSRVDRFSIGNEIVQVSNDKIYGQLLHALEHGVAIVDDLETDNKELLIKIRSAFSTAIKKAGITA